MHNTTTSADLSAFLDEARAAARIVDGPAGTTIEFPFLSRDGFDDDSDVLFAALVALTKAYAAALVDQGMVLGVAIDCALAGLEENLEDL